MVFPPDELTIVDAADNPATQLLPGEVLPVVAVNEVDNEIGTILFAAAATGPEAPGGDFVVARFRARANAAGLSSWILFSWDEWHSTGVYYGGESVLGGLQAAHVRTAGAGGLFLPLITKSYAVPQTALFQNDFNDGQLTGWTSNLGTWTNPGSFMRGAYTPGGAWNIRNVSATNFTYEGTLTLKSGNSAGLVFRSNDNGSQSYDAIIDIVDGAFKISKRSPYKALGRYTFTPQYNTAY